MDAIVKKITGLRADGWTLAALAEELGVHRETIYEWSAGNHSPANSKPVLTVLDSLSTRKPPPRRRYPGTHHLQRKTGKSGADSE